MRNLYLQNILKNNIYFSLYGYFLIRLFSKILRLLMLMIFIVLLIYLFLISLNETSKKIEN